MKPQLKKKLGNITRGILFVLNLYISDPALAEIKIVKQNPEIKFSFNRKKEKEKKLINIFEESFIKNIKKNNIQIINKNELLIYDEIDFKDYEKNQFSIYRGELRDSYYINRDKTMRAIWSALGDTFKATSCGKKIKEFEKRVSTYSNIEYSKYASDKTANLYLPGQLTPKKMREDNNYKVSLSSFFYTDADSLKGNFPIKLEVNYYNTNIYTDYDILNQKLGFGFSSKELNSYLGTNIKFSGHNKLNEKEISYFVKISKKF